MIITFLQSKSIISIDMTYIKKNKIKLFKRRIFKMDTCDLNI